ncbi:6-hydroxynicotinate 3-monooxygenase [Mycobacterium attenuatum]|uniref:6-hydroxynicotinate 3-monooxygenase n=2 Tax=Mycobacterium attenuatum TaxID=2341086 RepID=A0A498PRE5_9MYCO|nr:6-hydroxynicotinate 3-monooxygenase [Mycobacterium attenuatum]
MSFGALNAWGNCLNRLVATGACGPRSAARQNRCMRIAINGAGIAGVALAHWLHRIGHTPTVIEQAPRFRTGGYLIDFWGVGYQVAKRMGIEEAVRAAGYHVECLRSVGPGAEIKADVNVAVFRRMFGADLISLPRGDLAAAMYATVESKVETIFGDSITTVDQHDDGVRLTFQSSAARDFDLVIGADGLHSNVRRLVFGPEQSYEHYLGCKVAAWVVDGYRPRDELSYVTYNTPGRQVGRFALRGDRTMFVFIFRAARDRVDETPKDQLRNEFSECGWECPQILATLDEVDDLYFDVVSQIRMESWSRDRVLLIGDAAGCISLLGGEGTGLAITEAYVLAGELARAGGDHQRAFNVYEQRLRPFVTGKQAGAARLIGFFVTRTRFGLWFRNVAMRAVNFRPLGTLLAGSVRDDFELPDYGI